jgi:hypothetical protein
MITIPALVNTTPREEWPDADFEFPEGVPIHASDAEEDDFDMDWDTEMDLGRTGGAKAKAVVAGLAARSESFSKTSSIINIRPPLPSIDNEDEDDDEGVYTIKVNGLPALRPKTNQPVVNEDDDIEDAFSFPSDMTQLSLRPLSLHHQSSKGSLEWGDKDQTSSSHSSDTYSNLGLHDGSASSTYTSASLPETETDEDDEDDLDGLVIPSGLFDGGKKLHKILELKKKVVIEDRAKLVSPNVEDDFEIGLVIGDDFDLSPSRLLQAAQQSKRNTIAIRSKSAPSRPPSNLRPPSRLKPDRAKSPAGPPPSSMRQFRALAINTPRTQSYSEALAAAPSPTSSFLNGKTGSLRGQKSHSGLNPSPPSTQRRLGRKASLPSLKDPNQAEASGSQTAGGSALTSRYEAHTASSRAKLQPHTTSRAHGLDYVPPARPSTPSSNPAALRLTMPTNSSRLKARAPISAVFPNRPPSRSNSPHLTRPPSSVSLRHKHTASVPVPPPVKVLKKPKRQKTYGDGTELDGFDDLPLDGDKESQFRVQAKNHRVPGASYPKPVEKDTKGTLRRKIKREPSTSSLGVYLAPCRILLHADPSSEPTAATTNTLRRKGRIDISSKALTEETFKKKKTPNSPTSKKKPHLIRNIGGAATPKGWFLIVCIAILAESTTVVGEMQWNPHSLKWEGNDQALRDFDAAVGTSTRPALITHLTGSSIGSPVNSFANGARVVGNMIFDPARMCWISTLPPEDDEPDVFADLADDEEDGWETKGGTIRANLPTHELTPSETSESAPSSRMETPSPARSRRRSPSESGSERGSRASLVYDVDETFAASCHQAEERHRTELKGWKLKSDDLFDMPDRSYLWEIRALATRRY